MPVATSKSRLDGKEIEGLSGTWKKVVVGYILKKGRVLYAHTRSLFSVLLPTYVCSSRGLWRNCFGIQLPNDRKQSFGSKWDCKDHSKSRKRPARLSRKARCHPEAQTSLQSSLKLQSPFD